MIDVVIPCRNAPQVLSLTLTHLWAYGGDAVRSVTVLDNASTDARMPGLLDAVAQRPGHVVIRHERDVGVWASVNRGLATTTAARVLVLTADVLIGPDTLPVLLEVQRQTGLAIVAPDSRMPLTLTDHAALFARPSRYAVRPDYNGAVWLLDWARLREAVGWYDPQFYVCSGDTDYIERVGRLARETGDATLYPHTVSGLVVLHLDKQSRRVDFTAAGDTDVERRDNARFHAKWNALDADVAARHPMATTEHGVAYREQHLGGWETARVG